MNPTNIKILFTNIVLDCAQVNPAFMNWSEVDIQQAVSKYQFRFLKSETGEVAAMICFQKNFEFTEILALGTLKKFQRCGYSKKLLDEFLQKCSSTSQFVTLEVHSKNVRAIDLYKKCGFKTVRIRKNYYSDGSEALVMDKYFGHI